MKLHHITLLFTFILFFNCSSDPDVTEEPVAKKATASIAATINPANEPGTNGEVTISLTNAVAGPTIFTLSFGGTATNGVDFENIPNTFTISPGTTSVKFPVIIKDDTAVEGDETLEITISNSSNSNVTIGSSNKASLNITETLEDSAIIVLTPENVKSYLVNPNATAETVALFYNLKNMSKSKTILGQQDSFNHFYKNLGGDSDIKKTTGYDPGLNGLDFMFITDDKNDGTPNGQWYLEQENNIKKEAQDGYNKGIVNIFSWHLREPIKGEFFSTNQLSEQQKRDAFKSILPGGVNHEYYKLKLQKVAEVTKALIGADGKLIPIIFRPFHEFSGDWFWWGAAYCTPEQYIENWRFTVNYLKNDLNVNNMLFSFSPNATFNSESEYLSRYPGDDYVDVLAYDDYIFENNISSWSTNSNNQLQIISKLAKERVKIAAFAEMGYSINPSKNSQPAGLYTNTIYNAIAKNNVEIAFMMFWSNDEKSYYTPASGADTSDFVQFARKEDIVLLNNLPDMYTMPTQ